MESHHTLATASAEAPLEAKRVASFDLDHTKVRAPYVRLAGRYRGPRGDTVTKFDLRLVQPNRAELPTAALHTLEHLLAGYLRGALEGLEGVQLVDASPMGCRTGFYLTVLGQPAEADIAQALTRALHAVVAHQGEIPGCSERACGNYRDHSLPGAQAWARSILENDIRVQETVTVT
ncbi:S-ribosylhomocysteine lyase [Truepera radiovictrix]|uniref:S-ribosylhomocysteine lyase n=1 Tax=Truepera radiovictrix (strain DSM 17093 / CIP 108686 / LMG 22925 / RQ-24) TaxID=649638 RepID=D7CY71_TRURR|nr:S-ribosylhomocysteine lyase [Truepera radiovictrix]ADI14710.1 quorum-sensing autoinducer 2 (AI-2), LuxS [Truepera radiovictrix DSM 17093]WMT56740.1 S-ribosylhomocysteine lyase [Truepera radiovictrix]